MMMPAMIYVTEGKGREVGEGHGRHHDVRRATTQRTHPPTYTMHPVGVVHGGRWGRRGEQVLVSYGKLYRHRGGHAQHTVAGWPLDAR